MRLVLLVILSTFYLISFAQQQDSIRSVYDNDLLSKEFHQGRRDALRALMDSNSVAVLFSNPVRNKSNDIQFEYHQNPDMYYLTGLREPHAMLFVFKEEQHFDTLHTSEILFLQPRDSVSEMWTGKRYGVEGAKTKLGISNSYPNYYFASMKMDFSGYNKIYYILPQDDMRDNNRDRGDLYSLVKHFKNKADSTLKIVNAMELKEKMARLRQIKQTEELTLMINAIDFTCEAQKELMRCLSPGMYEYEAEAIIEYVIKTRGAEKEAFPSILGGGENSCVLHYQTNRKQLNDSDLLVVDVGAEYHGYAADVARTIPVSGKFTEEQRKVYELVLKAQELAIQKCTAGNKFWDPHSIAKEIIAQGLVDLGVSKEYSDVKKYFTHGTSHYLGLDVHDVGLHGVLKPGMVITVEPGVYIPESSDCDPKWWNIGVRIEDDILITGSKPEVLSGCVTKQIDEIELLMQEEAKIFK